MVTQDYNHLGRVIRTVGLGKHYPKTVKLDSAEGRKDRYEMGLNHYQKLEHKQMANDTLFRLVSTGVDIDNRIRQGTAVQI